MEDRIICDNVLKLRTALDLTCEEFADLLDTKVSSYCRYELSLGFTLDELEILANRMGVTVGILLLEDNITSDDFLDNLSKEGFLINDSALMLSDSSDEIMQEIEEKVNENENEKDNEEDIPLIKQVAFPNPEDLI